MHDTFANSTDASVVPGQVGGPMLSMPEGRSIDLAGIYRGNAGFLLGAGPSLSAVDLSKLMLRGVLLCAMNNVAAIVRPHLWVSVDDPGNFADVIWRDPAIIKFLPHEHMDQQLVARDANGGLFVSADRVAAMPAVFGYHRNERFDPSRWLYEETFNWGNRGNEPDLDGNTGGRSVMLVALRMLFYLGIRHVYLLGCDFRMALDQQNYAFPQARTRAAVHNNNNTFRILNHRLRHLKPHFDAAGFRVRNCTEGSELDAFPNVTLDEALSAVTAHMPKTISTEGMYDRQQRERDSRKGT